MQFKTISNMSPLKYILLYILRTGVHHVTVWNINCTLGHPNRKSSKKNKEALIRVLGGSSGLFVHVGVIEEVCVCVLPRAQM